MTRTTYLAKRRDELAAELATADAMDARLIRPLLRSIEQELAELTA